MERGPPCAALRGPVVAGKAAEEKGRSVGDGELNGGDKHDNTEHPSAGKPRVNRKNGDRIEANKSSSIHASLRGQQSFCEDIREDIRGRECCDRAPRDRNRLRSKDKGEIPERKVPDDPMFGGDCHQRGPYELQRGFQGVDGYRHRRVA